MTNKCDMCEHKDVCKYKEDYIKRIEEIEKLDDSKDFPLDLGCRFYKTPYWSYQPANNTISVGTTTNTDGQKIQYLSGCTTTDTDWQKQQTITLS